MSTELVSVEPPFLIDPEKGLIVDRGTGEAVAIADAEDGTLARLDDQLRALRDFAKSGAAVVDEELKARLKATRAKTLDVGSHLIELERKRQWDRDATWTALKGLVAAGLISEADADEACPEKTERKPDGRKLNALLTQLVGDDPEAAQPLAKARTESTWIKLESRAVDGEVAA